MAKRIWQRIAAYLNSVILKRMFPIETSSLLLSNRSFAIIIYCLYGIVLTGQSTFLNNCCGMCVWYAYVLYTILKLASIVIINVYVAYHRYFLFDSHPFSQTKINRINWIFLHLLSRSDKSILIAETVVN